jgi:hypothetical protein
MSASVQNVVLCSLCGALGLGCSAQGEDASPAPFGSTGGNAGNTSVAGPGGAGGAPNTGLGGNAGNLPSLAGNAGQTASGGNGGNAQTGTGGGGPGTGGSALTPNGGNSGAGNVTPVSCDDALFCDGFEAATAGAFPNTSPWIANACPSHVVDAAVARTGSQSLRGGAEMYPACMAHADLSGENEIYARSWVQLGASSTQSGHEVGLLEFGPTNADNPEVRVGFRDNDSVCVAAPGLEVTVDGIPGGERTTCSGVALEPNRWYCLEVHFSRSAGRIAYSVQVDGQSVVPETEYTDPVAAWTEGPMFMKLGRSSYGGNNVWPVWHDDVIVATQPVGCTD